MITKNNVFLSRLKAYCVLLCIFFPACQGLQQFSTARINRIIADHGLQLAYIGIEVRSVASGRYLIRHNADQHFVPASNMKLYTSAAALLALSPEFRYKTKLMTDGVITDGILRGNLIIIASGDPTMSGYFNSGNPAEVFENWSKALIEKGVHRIDGDIRVDNTYFEGAEFGKGWQWDDTFQCYGAAIDAFSFNNNCVAVEVIPGNEIGSAAIIRKEPDTTYFSVLNDIITTGPETKISIRRSRTADVGTNGTALSGTIPVNTGKYTLYEPVKKPAVFAASVFKEVLSQKGLVVTGQVICETGNYRRNHSTLTIVAEHQSPSLAEIIKVVNSISSNLYAENLFLTIARESSGHGNAGYAERSIHQLLNRLGLRTDRLRIADGSGLSRLNLITPHDTVDLLYLMAQSSNGQVFMDSLAIPGKKGTLKRMDLLSRTPLNVRAKTGSMTNVRNMSGYITTAGGELFAFSFLCNNSTHSAEEIDRLYAAILKQIALLHSGSD